VTKSNPLVELKDGLGLISKDGMWAAVPFYGKKFVIIYNGKQVHTSNTIESAKTFIINRLKFK
jgi:hypothetical protein